jgi:DNA-binding CsgD family transcriptional regulator
MNAHRVRRPANPAGRTRMTQRRTGIRQPTLESFADLVEHVYAAGLDEAAWPVALQKLIEFVGNSGTHLFMMDAESGLVSRTVHVGMPDHMLAEYNGEVIRECPRYRNAREHPERTFLFDYQHIDERDIDHNEYYHWLQTTGDDIRYYLGGRLALGAGQEGFLSLAFRRSEGHSQSQHLERFAYVLPHVSRALRVGRQLAANQSSAGWSLDALERLEHGVVCIDRRNRVTYANARATELACAPFGLDLTDARLRLQCPTANQQLQRLVAEAARRPTGAADGADGSLFVPSRLGQPQIRIQVAPLRLAGAARDANDGHVPVVVAFLYRIGNWRRPSAEYLHAAFSLTPAETRIALALADGMTLEQIAVHAHVSLATVRTQLKQVFAKTGVHRQADLVRFVGTMSMPPGVGRGA